MVRLQDHFFIVEVTDSYLHTFSKNDVSSKIFCFRVSVRVKIRAGVSSGNTFSVKRVFQTSVVELNRYSQCKSIIRYNPGISA